MKGLKIRKATLKDLSEIMNLQYKMKAEEKEYMQDINKRGKFLTYPKSEIKKILTSPNGCLFLAEIDKKLIGCGLARMEKTPNWMKYKKQGYLGMIYVDKKFRRKGIASRLKKERLKWLKSKRIKFCYVKVFSNNKPSLEFQKKSGFKPYIIKLYKKIK